MNGRVIAFLSRLVGRQAETSTSGRSTIPSFPSLVTDGEPAARIVATEWSRYFRQSMCADRDDPLVCLSAGGPPTCKDFTSWYAAQLTRKLQKPDPYAFRWSWTGQSARV